MPFSIATSSKGWSRCIAWSCLCWGSRLSSGLSSSSSSSSSASSSSSLSNTYRGIALRSNQLVRRWPDSQKLCEECLVYNEDTRSYQLPTFLDGHGPLGVFSFLGRNEKASYIMEACDLVFASFCEQIATDVLITSSRRSRQEQHDALLQNWILRSPAKSHHISVAILQEHPSFLRNPEDLAKWKPIPNSTIQQLSIMFAQDHANVPAPQLELDSLLWTPDGAMIAGFIDISEEGVLFESLRRSCRRIVHDTLGDVLTTRPKNLIHATIGRIVGLPPVSSYAEYHALSALARHYNEEILPATVDQIRNDKKDCFELVELSLARNIRWMLYEYEEYATWRTAPPV